MEIAEVLEGHWKVSDEVQHSEDVDLIWYGLVRKSRETCPNPTVYRHFPISMAINWGESFGRRAGQFQPTGEKRETKKLTVNGWKMLKVCTIMYLQLWPFTSYKYL